MKRSGWGWLIPMLAMLPIALSTRIAAAAEPFQAGQHYVALPNPQPVETGDKIELREFFWYGCSHCYTLEPALNAYLKKLPANARFVRTPGVSPNWLVHAQAFYTFEVLGVTAKLHGPFFEASQPSGPRPSDAASIADFAAKHGVNKAKFSETFNSFAVRTRVERARQQNIGFVVDGVPMLAVDGRYLTSPAIAGGREPDEAKRSEMAMKVVDFLIRKAAKERKKAPVKG